MRRRFDALRDVLARFAEKASSEGATFALLRAASWLALLSCGCVVASFMFHGEPWGRVAITSDLAFGGMPAALLLPLMVVSGLAVIGLNRPRGVMVPLGDSLSERPRRVLTDLASVLKSLTAFARVLASAKALALAALDGLTVMAALVASASVTRVGTGFSLLTILVREWKGATVIALSVHLLVFYLFELYNLRLDFRRGSNLLRCIGAVVTASIVLAVLSFIVPRWGFGRWLFALHAALLTVATCISRVAVSRMLALREPPERAFSVVGIMLSIGAALAVVVTFLSGESAGELQALAVVAALAGVSHLLFTLLATPSSPSARRPGLFGGVLLAGLALVVVASRRTAAPSAPLVLRQLLPRDPDDRGVFGCPNGMALIPGGEFMMGYEGAGAGPNDGHPMHWVRVSAFCLDRTEVSVAAFRGWWGAGDHPPPGAIVYPGDQTLTVDGPIRGPDSGTYCTWSPQPAALEQHPINCVNWSTAQAFCVAQDGRLPTEAEWEFAARGPRGRTFPWGEASPNGTLENLCGAECVEFARQHGDTFTGIPGWRDAYGGVAPVTAFPSGATPEGVLNLAGNVYEWVADAYQSPYYVTETGAISDPLDADSGTRVLRGGGWHFLDAAWSRGAARNDCEPSGRLDFLGFRCARGATYHPSIPNP